MNPASFIITDNNSGFNPKVPNPSVSISDIAEDKQVVIEVAYINARTGFLKLSAHVAEDLISLTKRVQSSFTAPRIAFRAISDLGIS